MTYKSSFYFIADCLQLKVTTSTRLGLISQIEDGKVNWEDVVRIASSHLVIPLLYIRIIESNLLHFLPPDLQVYLEKITNLNRARNTLLLEEVKQLNNIFFDKNIQVIYLKGTALLLKGIYHDVGERMIGDIDLLVAPNKMEYVAHILSELGYKPLTKYDPSLFNQTKHYPRMSNPNKCFALEIHKDVIQKMSKRKLVFADYDKEKVGLDSYFLPSIKHLIWHNILNTQLNDYGYLLSSLNLRQQYDLLLLSQISAVDDVVKSNHHFRKEMLAYLIKTKYVFKYVKELNYSANYRSKIYELFLDLRFNNPKLFTLLIQIKYLFFIIFNDLFYFVRSLFHSIKRRRMLHHLTDIDWLILYFSKLLSKIKSVKIR